MRDVDVAGDPAPPRAAEVEVLASRVAAVGDFTVRRALPHRARRTIGAWCFVDHMGPATIDPELGLGVAPHPHIGLQTVTWLLEGEALHRDSLGTEQPIRPGQLNLMTAGTGVSHSEEGTGRGGDRAHGVQLWVALPEETRHGDAAFEHHADPPHVELARATATVLVGAFAGTASPARRDTDHAGVDLVLHGGCATLPLRPEYEHGVVVLDGSVAFEGRDVTPGHLAYLGPGRDELALDADGPARVLLVGGVPLPEPPLMWWNYVARTREEISEAHEQWTRRDPRFGSVRSELAPIDVPPPPWTARSG